MVTVGHRPIVRGFESHRGRFHLGLQASYAISRLLSAREQNVPRNG